MATSQAPKPPSLFGDNYVEEGILGDGFFGTVYKCRSKKNGVSYAIKVTNFSEQALREVTVIHNLPPHPNVVQYFDFWKDEFPCRHRYSDLSSSPDCKNVKVLCIPMELCIGTLRSRITSQLEITEEMFGNISLQLISGLEHIHRNNIIHRDLKPENILIGLDSLIIKIGDFGLSSQHGDAMSHTPDVGNRLYRAPEQGTGQYNSSADIYAMGLIFFEIGYSQMENGRDWEERRRAIRELKQVKKIPQAFQKKWGHVSQLILKMIKDNPIKRPNAAEVKDFLSIGNMKLSEKSESISDNSKSQIRSKSMRNYSETRASVVRSLIKGDEHSEAIEEVWTLKKDDKTIFGPSHQLTLSYTHNHALCLHKQWEEEKTRTGHSDRMEMEEMTGARSTFSDYLCRYSIPNERERIAEIEKRVVRRSSLTSCVLL